jgi:hypothetical protein
MEKGNFLESTSKAEQEENEHVAHILEEIYNNIVMG